MGSKSGSEVGRKLGSKSGKKGVSYLIVAVLLMLLSQPAQRADAAVTELPSPWALEAVNRAVALGLVPARMQSGYTQTLSRAGFCALAVTVYEKATNKEIADMADADIEAAAAGAGDAAGGQAATGEGSVAGRAAAVSQDAAVSREAAAGGQATDVEKAAAIGVIAAADGDWALPGDRLSREYAALLAVRLSAALGAVLPKPTEAFADTDSVSFWAREAVAQARAAGMMGGTGENRFSPKENFTLEQGIAVLLKLYDGFNLTVQIGGQDTPLGAMFAAGESAKLREESEKLREESAKLREKDENLRRYAGSVIELVNAERIKAGLAALSEMEKHDEAAAARAIELGTQFAHERPDGRRYSTVLGDYGIAYGTCGENAAFGQTSPEQVVRGWMDSPGHRENILNPDYSKSGAGVYKNADGWLYWELLFTG